MANKKWFWLPLFVLALVGCGGDGGSSDDDDESTETTATVKVLPVSGNSPLMSVLVDTDPSDDEDGRALSNQAYAQASAFNVAVGDTGFTVRYVLPKEAGTEVEYTEALDPFEVNAEGGIRYEIFIGGSYPSVESWIVETPRGFDESDTQARLTLVNAAPAMPEMDVHLVDAGQPIDSSTLLTSLSYKEADNSVRVDKGDYQVKIAEAGSNTAVYTSEEFTLSAGSDLTLAAINNAWVKEGVTGKSPVVLNRSGPSGGSSLAFDTAAGVELRVAHASPDAGALDVVIDNDFTDPFAEDFMLGQVTDYVTLDSGVHQFTVVPANGASPVYIDTNYNLYNALAWTMLVVEPLASLDPLFVSENARPIAAHARLRLIHASNEAGTVDVYITKPNADLSEENEDGDPVYTPRGTGLTLKNVSNYLALDAGTYEITFTDTVASGETAPESPEVVYGPLTVTVVDGEVYTLMLRDAADESVTHQWLDGSPES